MKTKYKKTEFFFVQDLALESHLLGTGTVPQINCFLFDLGIPLSDQVLSPPTALQEKTDPK